MRWQSLLMLPFLIGAVQPAGAEGPAAYDRAKDAHGFPVFLEDAGWCWFQDPRALLLDDAVIAAGVASNGDIVAGYFDLAAGASRDRALLRGDSPENDHNAPAFYLRPDGRLLAMYALHNVNRNHYYRIAHLDGPWTWGPEQVFEHDYPKADRVTYMNLFPLASEGKVYNFYRGIAFNPCFITSEDHGDSWGEPTHFITSEIDGRHRPYVRYAGNGVDTIHLSLTDGHPRNVGNSLYYAAFRAGKFLRVDGSVIKTLAEDGPLRPSESERIYEGSGEVSDEPGTVPGAAWASAIALDQNGHPHVAYSVHLHNEDHRYRVAHWNGKEWIDREVAHGGHCLYERESSYTGLIALDPNDPAEVVISTNVDPGTGADSGGKHEIYRARIRPDDSIETIAWEALTKDSPVRNLRPLVLSDGNRRVILWLRGVYNTYTDYDQDVVGIVEE